MKWIYKIDHKYKMALALTIVVFLVLGTNMVNNSHFTEIQRSFSSVYEDRLLVENYIYKLSVTLNDKRRCLIDSSTVKSKMNSIQIFNDSIQKLMVQYQLTKLTVKEAELFNEFKHTTALLQQNEIEYLDHKTDIVELSIHDQHEKLSDLLEGLSEIQLIEGKKLITDSNVIVASNSLYSYLEIILIIIIGLFIQALLFASKSLEPKFNQDERLN
jgi:hypothetical protein